jgi:hypothetical protein
VVRVREGSAHGPRRDAGAYLCRPSDRCEACFAGPVPRDTPIAGRRFTEEVVPGIVRHRRSEGGNESRDLWRAPDFAEPDRARRVWCVLLQEQQLRLRSLFFPLLWEPGRRVEAECLHRRLLRPWQRRSHGAPHGRCDCGIYATTTLSGATDYLRVMPPAPPVAIQYALGRVSLWGVVIECERGWRASYAYPAALYMLTRPTARRPPLTPREVAEGLAAYGVPVTVTDGSDPVQTRRGDRELIAEKH